jgi:hypothetical protein
MYIGAVASTKATTEDTEYSTKTEDTEDSFAAVIRVPWPRRFSSVTSVVTL